MKQKTNNNNFEVPQHYFEDLTERIQTQIALTEMPKAENTFAVPENYFDNLQSRITNRIATSGPKKRQRLFLYGDATLLNMQVLHVLF